MQFLLLEGYTKERALPETNIFKRDYSNFSEREFFDTVINGTDWEEVCMLRYKNASVSFKSFYDKISFHLDKMAPLKKVTQKEFRLMLKPWITHDI